MNKVFAMAMPPICLPQDDHCGAYEHVDVKFLKPAIRKMQTFCSKKGVTANVVLLSAFSALLIKYLAAEKIVLKAVIDNKSFILSFQKAGQYNFHQLVDSVNTQLSGKRGIPLRAGIEYPYTFVSGSTEDFNYSGIITLLVEPRENPHCKITFDQTVVPRWYVQQWLDHFMLLLYRWCQQPQKILSELPLLSENEQKHVLAITKECRMDYPADSIYQLFIQQLTVTPEQLAIKGNSVRNEFISVTYRQLHEKVEAVAAKIRYSGIPSAAVGVYLPRSVESLVCLLAIIKTGHLYVPLDAAFPFSYVKQIAEDAGLKIILCDEFRKKEATALAEQVICIEAEDRMPPAQANQPKVDIDSPLLIMYTSGSTGKPKGVMHVQRQVVNRLHWMWNDYPFKEGDVIGQRSSVNVMPSMWEMLGGLLKGVTTVIIGTELQREPREFVQFISEHQLSFLTLTPSLLKAMLQYDDCTIWLASLRMIIVGGEPLSFQLYQQFRERLPHATLINDFGATEVNTILHSAFSPSQTLQEVNPAAGTPIANVKVYILDQNLQVLPPGILGELYVGGHSLALGYYNNDLQNQNKFFLHPILGRLYRTGDAGLLLPNGQIEMKGRMDGAVKINAFLVETAQIEQAILNCSGISKCAVIARTLSSGKHQLHAFVETDDDTIDQRLRQQLTETLPWFMVPSVLHCMSSLPLRPNGKIDRMLLHEQAGKKSVPQETDNERSVVQTIRTNVAAILEMPEASIPLATPFFEMGMDSMGAVVLVQNLEKIYRINLPVSSLFDHPTVQKLSNYIAVLNGSINSVTNEAAKNASQPNNEEKDIAVIGMSGRFPKAANVREFWSNLLEGKECIEEIPSQRWDIAHTYDPDPSKKGKSISKWAGLLDNIDQFEPLFFNLSPQEACFIDPQHRFVLMEAWNALEDAAYTPESLANHQVGVYIGAKKGDYDSLFDSECIVPSAETLIGNDAAVLSARLSYFLNLHGPNLTIDTACSSSLVALHLACQAIRTGEIDMALIGGVCINHAASFYVATSKLGIFSPSGKCRAFDNDADGFVHGEGVAFVVLRLLADAKANNDFIYGIIKGTSVNHGGRANGLASPGAIAQSAVQLQAYQRFGINPEMISYIEAHGTGTRLGDPIEVDALTRSFRKYTERSQFCGIGSVKTNIGHLTAAAGITGLIKVLLSLVHRTLPPSLNFAKPNEHINFSESPFYVVKEKQEWKPDNGQPLVAAVNSFGMGGTNAHCVVQEARQKRTQTTILPWYLVTLSARTPDSLMARMKELAIWLKQNPSASLDDIAYTLCVGRFFFPFYQLFLVSSTQDFYYQLQQSVVTPAYKEHHPKKELTHHPTPDMNLLNEEEYYKQLLDLKIWIEQGNRPDWKVVFGKATGNRIPLPGYSFDTQSYWVNKPRSQGAMAPMHHQQATNDVSGKNGQNLRQVLLTSIVRLLEISADQLLHSVSLDKYGFDSIKAVSLKYDLERVLAREISMEHLNPHHTLEEIENAVSASGTDAEKDTIKELVDRFLNNQLDIETLDSATLDEMFEYLQNSPSIKE